MVRRVKFISSQSTYREVKLLLDSSSLKSIPLVDSKGELVKDTKRAFRIISQPPSENSDSWFSFLSPESMILLGSIDRLELLALCDWWLSPERRLLMQVSQRSCGLVLRPAAGLTPDLSDLCSCGFRVRVSRSRTRLRNTAGSPSPLWMRRRRSDRRWGSSCLYLRHISSMFPGSSVRCPSPHLFVACRAARCRRRGTAPCLPQRPPRSPL